MSIELKNIEMNFGAKELFKINHLFLSTGSRVGIIGDNGAGKSTILSLIEGTLIPTKGSVICNEEVAVIPQLIDETARKSGGEQTKQRIIEALKKQGGILLADEPTNHLDDRGIAFLKRKLNSYQGTLVIISHDRAFLNQTVDKILEIEQGKVTLFEGNYDSYLEQREQQGVEQEKVYEKYQQERRHIEQAMRKVSDKSEQTRKTPRRMGNSEARIHKMGNQRAKKNLDNKVKALNARLEQLQVIEKTKTKKALVIPVTLTQKLHKKILINASHFSLKNGEKKLFDEAKFQLINGTKAVLLGPNGSGKTSLFKEIANRNPLFSYAQGVRIGYFSQTFEQLEKNKTIFENIQDCSSQEEQIIRDLLAHMQFRGETIYKKIDVLSGGERSKVAISKLLLGDFNVLLLDEPTNHLDISSIKVLEEAIKIYPGTILFTSHDKNFIENCATEKWQIANKKILLVSEELRKTITEEQEIQQKLLLENRKTKLFSELSFADDAKKLDLEKELQQVLNQLKE